MGLRRMVLDTTAVSDIAALYRMQAEFGRERRGQRGIRPGEAGTARIQGTRITNCNEWLYRSTRGANPSVAPRAEGVSGAAVQSLSEHVVINLFQPPPPPRWQFALMMNRIRVRRKVRYQS